LRDDENRGYKMPRGKTKIVLILGALLFALQSTAKSQDGDIVRMECGSGYIFDIFMSAKKVERVNSNVKIYSHTIRFLPDRIEFSYEEIHNYRYNYTWKIDRNGGGAIKTEQREGYSAQESTTYECGLRERKKIF
jgi:hypothetical protein